MRILSKGRICTFIITFILITSILAIPINLIYENAKDLIIYELGKHAMNISATAASFIEQDIEPYKELSFTDEYVQGSYNQIYYEKMQKLFQKLKKETSVDFIFTEKKVSDTEIAYIIDGEDPNSELFSPLGSTDSMSAVDLKSFNEGIIIASDLIHDEVWGDFITGFAPIMDDETGEVIGLVGVDFSLEYIQKMINGISTIIFISFFIVILLTSIVFNRLLARHSKSLNTDYMTEIYSKRYHDYHLKRVIKDAKFTGKTFSLIMLDIDNFKEINDQFGHLVGDKVLKSVAQIMQMNMRSVDACSRYGGDEFVIILPGTNQEQAVLICKRIQKRILNLDMCTEAEEQIYISLSIGIAEWNRSMSSEKLTECADQAMYISKNAGKNKITIYKESGFDTH